jgi:hypothetical protein
MLTLNQVLSNFLSRLGFKIRTNLVICCTGLCLVFPFATSVVNGRISYGEAFASLETNRDKILTQYAYDRGYSSACEIWGNMSASQKGVFLTITDLLGRRSYMNSPRINYQLIVGRGRDSCIQMNGTSTDCNNGCYVRLDVNSSVCSFVNGHTCAQYGKCTATPDRNEHDLALNHVSKFYAINGGGSSCGGSSNRIFLQADQALMHNLRNIWFGLPIWRNSSDLAGPHTPFTQSRETNRGLPGGQTHQWAWDYEASYLFRENFVNYVLDPNMVEIDIDYNFVHDSNPECYYDGIRGRYYYQNYWSNSGLGGSAELDYTPCS